jgi:HPt (histidine-containing phosphotransfer) domain-containing protein
MDLSILADELGLDGEGVLHLVRTFLKSTMQDLCALEQALTDRDAEAAARLAHHIKGAAANLELTVIAEAALAVEKSAAGGNFGGLGQQVAAISRELKTIQDGLGPA